MSKQWDIPYEDYNFENFKRLNNKIEKDNIKFEKDYDKFKEEYNNIEGQDFETDMDSYIKSLMLVNLNNILLGDIIVNIIFTILLSIAIGLGTEQLIIENQYWYIILIPICIYQIYDCIKDIKQSSYLHGWAKKIIKEIKKNINK